VILERAKHEIEPRGRYKAERLNRILRECGIKKIQFAQVVAEDSQLNDLFQHFQAKPGWKRRTL
jgi:hypothetical protein